MRASEAIRRLWDSRCRVGKGPLIAVVDASASAAKKVSGEVPLNRLTGRSMQHGLRADGRNSCAGLRRRESLRRVLGQTKFANLERFMEDK